MAAAQHHGAGHSLLLNSSDDGRGMSMHVPSHQKPTFHTLATLWPSVAYSTLPLQKMDQVFRHFLVFLLLTTTTSAREYWSSIPVVRTQVVSIRQ